MSDITLLYGGVASAEKDIVVTDDAISSIVVYDREYYRRNMAEYVDVGDRAVFIRCKFIECTGLDTLWLHDCIVSTLTPS